MAHRCCQDFSRSEVLRRAGAAVVPTPELDPRMPVPAGTGLQRRLRKCVVWEGVFSYLTVAAIDETLRWVADVCPAGSRLILTYVDAAALRPTDEKAAWIDRIERWTEAA